MAREVDIGTAFKQAGGLAGAVLDAVARQLPEIILEDVQQNAPFKTGKLRRSHEVEIKREPDKITIEVSAGGRGGVFYHRIVNQATPWMDDTAKDKEGDWRDVMESQMDRVVPR